MRVDVCFLPDSIQNYFLKDKTLVVIDIFRASSTIVSAMASGFESFIVLKSQDEIPSAKKSGYLIAAEQNASKLYDANFGNSPLTFVGKSFKNQQLAFFTTNGTRTLNLLNGQNQKVLIASFLNIDAVAKEIALYNKDCLLICSGWKSNFSMEDSLFAGALADKLSVEMGFSINTDAAIAAQMLWNASKSNLLEFLSGCEHFNRLKELGYEEDALFCLKKNVYDVVPKFNPLTSKIEL